MKRLLITLITILVIALLAFLTFKTFVKDRDYVVVIPQSRIDAELSKRFPMTKDIMQMFSVNFTNPDITLLPGTERVRVSTDVTLNLNIPGQNQNPAGKCIVTTGIRYNNQEKSFYLVDAEIDQLDFQGLPQEQLEKIKIFAATLVQEHLQHHPIYTLTSEDIKSSAASLLLKDLRVTDTGIHATLGL